MLGTAPKRRGRPPKNAAPAPAAVAAEPASAKVGSFWVNDETAACSRWLGIVGLSVPCSPPSYLCWRATAELLPQHHHNPAGVSFQANRVLPGQTRSC